MVINAVAIVLSLMALLTPTTGALVHNAGSCFVVLIAALLYDRKFGTDRLRHPKRKRRFSRVRQHQTFQ